MVGSGSRGAEGLVCRPGSVPGRLATLRSATIHLGPPLPTTSCGPPAHSGGQPSSVRCSTLLRTGFTEPIRSPGSLVVSCTTVSPLPEPPSVSTSSTSDGDQAVCSLWHCPAGCPGWVLPTALPFGARTFLDTCSYQLIPARCRGRPTNPSALAIVGQGGRVSTGSTNDHDQRPRPTTTTDDQRRTPGRPVEGRPGVAHGQLVVSAVSSTTNEVWREESSAPLNEIVTVCPAKDDRLNDFWL